jgi:segregation and condensation protein B
MHEPEKVRMSRAALETLAIIAYRQPITRPEIEAVRGVNVDGVIVRLLEYGLIEEQGRKEAPGRPMLYGTTEDFLVHFGLDSVKDLPQLPEVDEAAVEAVAALPEEVEIPLTEGSSVEEAPAEDTSSEETSAVE